MWKLQQNSTTLASYGDSNSGCEFHCDLARPDWGMRFMRSGDAVTTSQPLILLPSDSGTPSDLRSEPSIPCFPKLHETYFRGSDAIAILPQDEDHQFGVSTTYRVLPSSDSSLTIEVVLAIQTQLLDASPTMDLHVEAPFEAFELDKAQGDSATPNLKSSKALGTSRPFATYLSVDAKVPVSLSLPPMDQRVATQLQAPTDGLHLRLLSEFMEKGVIRKTRFWLTCWNTSPSQAELTEIYHRLQSEPLPLTP